MTDIELISLQNKDKLKLIEGVLLYPLKINRDESGVLVETLRTDWPNVYGDERKFAMQYYSITQPNVARDEKVWHMHPSQEDRFIIARGEIVTAIADNRQDSETKGLLNLFYMKSQEDPYILLIPKMTLHGFMVVSKDEGVLLNFPTKLYDSKEELRIPYGEANVTANGQTFSWDLVRKKFNPSNV